MSSPGAVATVVDRLQSDHDQEGCGVRPVAPLPRAEIGRQIQIVADALREDSWASRSLVELPRLETLMTWLSCSDEGVTWMSRRPLAVPTDAGLGAQPARWEAALVDLAVYRMTLVNPEGLDQLLLVLAWIALHHAERTGRPAAIARQSVMRAVVRGHRAGLVPTERVAAWWSDLWFQPVVDVAAELRRLGSATQRVFVSATFGRRTMQALGVAGTSKQRRLAVTEAKTAPPPARLPVPLRDLCTAARQVARKMPAGSVPALAPEPDRWGGLRLRPIAYGPSQPWWGAAKRLAKPMVLRCNPPEESATGLMLQVGLNPAAVVALFSMRSDAEDDGHPPITWNSHIWLGADQDRLKRLALDLAKIERVSIAFASIGTIDAPDRLRGRPLVRSHWRWTPSLAVRAMARSRSPNPIVVLTDIDRLARRPDRQADVLDALVELAAGGTDDPFLKTPVQSRYITWIVLSADADLARRFGERHPDYELPSVNIGTLDPETPKAIAPTTPAETVAWAFEDLCAAAAAGRWQVRRDGPPPHRLVELLAAGKLTARELRTALRRWGFSKRLRAA